MGIFLLPAFFLIRFGLLSFFNQEAVKRAASFAPLLEKEKAAYWLYQISNIAIFLYLCFLRIRFVPVWLLATGFAVYAAGLVLLALSVIYFSFPAENGIIRGGPYRISRHPMYVAYFIYFTGCAVITQSVILFVLILLFQISSHWIILSEERWCVQKFGAEYLQYMEQVRRYL